MQVNVYDLLAENSHKHNIIPRKFTKSQNFSLFLEDETPRKVFIKYVPTQMYAFSRERARDLSLLQMINKSKLFDVLLLCQKAI